MLKAEIYTDQAGEIRWRIRAANGEPIANGSEGYKRIGDARAGLELVIGPDRIDVEVVEL